MENKIEKSFMSIRIPTQRWLDKTMFTEVLDLLDANKGVVDELALFSGFTHPPLPLETIYNYAPIMTASITAANARGYACGVNILSTMGHHNENLENSLTGDYTRRTDLEGKTCLGSFCPNDERFVREYVIPLYTKISETKPNFIWIDDDVRSGHGGIGPDCFCEHCLAEFAKLSGTLYTRETIAEALNCGEVTKKLAFRKLWLQGKRDTINRLFDTIEKTVHGINPGIKLGFMTGERYADGYDFDTQAGILAGPKSQEVMWRPGGGFYRDDTPKDMAGKAHDIGRQIALLPEQVRYIQSEIENFNYEALGKSIYINSVEVSAYIAAGCTGAALNIMNLYEDIVLEKGPLLKEIKRQRPFYDALTAAQGRLLTQGVFTGWNKDSEAACNLSGKWFGPPEGINPHFADEWFEIGIPMAYGAEKAQMAMFRSFSPYSFTEEQLLGWLTKGVYLDGPALEVLNNMGYGELTGFKVTGDENEDCIEELNDHPLNGGQKGRMRDCRQSFWKYNCAVLEPTATGAHPLAKAVDYSNKTKAACSMGVFENRLGGRVCVAGYYPWSFVLSHSKAEQCKNVIRWLTKDTIPAYVSSLHKVALWSRENTGGQKILTLLNQSMDPAENLTLKVLTDKNNLRVLDKNMVETLVQSIGTDGDYKIFHLPVLPAWSMLLAVTE
ncbi:MAG: hypothetical protein WCN92_08935 [Eubacteriales bacterium]